MTNNRIAKIKFYLLILLIIISLVFSIYFKTQGISKEDIQFYLDSNYAPLYFILFYVAVSFLPIPFAPVMFLGAFIFPFKYAVLYTLIGSFIFSTLSFYIARFLGKDYADYLRSKNKKIRKADLKLTKDEFENILLLRFFFIIPGEIINVYSGMSRIHYKQFIKATLIGVLPVIICSIGLIRGQIRDDVVSIILSIIGLIVMLIIPILYSTSIRKRFKWKNKK